MDLATFTNDLPGYLNLAIQVLLPILVGLVTTRVTHAGVKSVLLLFLTAVNQFAIEWLVSVNSTATFQWRDAVWGVVIGFAISVVTHFGLLKPAAVTGTDSWAEAHGRKPHYGLAR